MMDEETRDKVASALATVKASRDSLIYAAPEMWPVFALDLLRGAATMAKLSGIDVEAALFGVKHER